MLNQEPRYLTVKQTADLFKVSTSTIRRGLRSGRLRGVWLGPQTVRVLMPSPHINSQKTKFSRTDSVQGGREGRRSP